MSDVPLIFVSHSSKDNQLTRDVCAALTATPPGDSSGYRVLVDFEDLQTSDNWPRYLIEWMARCHAGVILLTKDAIASPWVLKEVTILTARWSLDPAFKLFVIKFPGTKDLLEQHGFGPLHLGTIHQAPYKTPQGVAAVVRQVLPAGPAARTPFDELAGSIRDLLERVGRNALITVAAQLNTIPDRLSFTRTEDERRIDTITRHLLCGNLGAFSGVHELIDKINTADAGVARSILRLVSPYWIDRANAFRLARLLKGAPRRAAAINGADVADFTARLYVRRAHEPSLLFDLIPIAGGMHDKYVEHVTNEICAFLRTRKRSLSAKKNEEIIATLRTQDPVWYAVLPPPLPDDEALGDLLDRFPTITFILWTGETLEVDRRLTRVEWLEPPIDVDREGRERDQFEQAEDVIRAIAS